MRRHLFPSLAILILLCGCGGSSNPSAQAPPPAAPPAANSPNGHSSHTTETATVERVFSVTTDDGYSENYYQVTWHGQPVIVEGSILFPAFKVGDKIGILIMRHDLTSQSGGKKHLHFAVLPEIPGQLP